MAAYLYNDDGDPLTDDGYSASFYAKYMFYENKTRTGGAAVKAAQECFRVPSREKTGRKTHLNPIGQIFLALFLFLKIDFQWDLMPGSKYDRRTMDKIRTTAWAFTYSGRLAWALKNPKWNIVGEVFGTGGEVVAIPEYKVGLRWEPSQYGVFALTYGHEFGGSLGAGFEFGVMLFTPPFACLGGCGGEKKEKKNIFKNMF